ncbi:MAG: hypothetical protein FJ291_00785 [Planctomycetes bacterium]|nr:hypothetical protein [Planctomycetota bacterium]
MPRTEAERKRRRRRFCVDSIRRCLHEYCKMYDTEAQQCKLKDLAERARKAALLRRAMSLGGRKDAEPCQDEPDLPSAETRAADAPPEAPS